MKNFLCAFLVISHKARLLFAVLCLFSIKNLLLAQWIQTNGPCGGDIRCFAVLGTNLFVGNYGGGVYLSTDNGSTWESRNTGLSNSKVTVLASLGTTLYAGTEGDGIFRSIDNGLSWTAVNNGLTNTYVNAITALGNKLFAGTRYGVFVSTNNGESWTAASIGFSYPYITALLTYDTSIFAGTSGFGVYISTNQGTSWSAANQGLNNRNVKCFAALDTKIFVGTGSGVYLTTDNGTTWSGVNSGLLSKPVYALLSVGSKLFAGAEGGGISVTTDNGGSWAYLNTGLYDLNVHALSFSNSTLFAGTTSGVFLSTNEGNNWSETNSGLIASNVLSLAASGTTLFAGTESGVQRSTDAGTTWVKVNNGLPVGSVREFAFSNETIFVATAEGVYFTTDNGANWQNKGFIIYSDVRTIRVIGSNLFAGTGGGGVFICPLNGTSWNASINGLTNNYVNALVEFNSNIFAGTEAGVFRSTDNGQSWTQTSLNNVIVSAFAISGTILFAGTEGGGIYYTNDNGANWVQINPFNTGFFVSDICIWENKIIVSTDRGIFISDNNGQSWTNVNSGLKTSNVPALSISGTLIFAGTSGYGVWRRPLSEMITSVEKYSLDLPSCFSVEQNYPNPFNSITTISFTLPTRSFVTLKIFDLLGKEVASLVAEELSGGTYTKQWNTEGLPSGVYFYRLHAGTFTETKKLILLK
ncbi:MAG: T9SS type A sorting domain-containing protein [Candidatus Kryptoniota bacterium]